MLDRVVSKMNQLAGFDLPAVPKPLNHLLCLSYQNNIEISVLVAAVETDPSLLAMFLFQQDQKNLNDWHLETDLEQFRQITLAASNRFTSTDQSEIALQYYERTWRRSLLHASLSAALAEQIGADVTTVKLLGLLAGLGHLLLARSHGEGYIKLVDGLTGFETVIQAEWEGFGCSGDTVGAACFKSLGYPSSCCDALRYQYISLEELPDATQLVQIIGYCGRLVELVQNPEQDPQLIAKADILFGLDADSISEIVAAARQVSSQARKRVTEFESDSSSIRENVANANMASITEKSLASGTHSISAVASLLFGAETTLLFKNSDDHLEASWDPAGKPDSVEVLSVDASSERSLVAQCFRQNKNITAEKESLDSIVDKQILDRLGTLAVRLLPLGENLGVVAIGVNQLLDIPGMLLDAYRQGVTAQIGLTQADEVLMLDAGLVRKQVREVTHEVNNPLAIAQNFLRTLSLKLDEDSPVQADIETISREMMRVSGIVKKYDQIGRQEAPIAEEVNVNDILEQLTSVFRGGYEEVQFETVYDKGMPFVSIIPDNLKQVIVNLVKNAVEALEDVTGAKVGITTHGSINLGGDQYIEILIMDNGPGIPLPLRDKLFRPNNSAKGGAHAGLGLSIVKQLIVEMGSLISCRTQVAGEGIPGTTFQILIPLIGKK